MLEFHVSHGDGTPSGENLEYEPVFTDMLLAARPGEERQAGRETLPGAPSDPVGLDAAAAAVLRQTHDLRAAVLMADARTRMNGLAGFADATAYICFCLEDHWDTCHPQIDPDDGDPTMRVNTLAGLADPQGLLRALRTVPLTQSATFGRISLRDIEIAEGTIPAPEDGDGPDAASVAAAFKDTDAAVLNERLLAAQTALANVARMDAVFDARLPGAGPQLDALSAVLKRVVARLGAEAGVAVETDVDIGPLPSGAAPSGGKDKPASPGTIAGPRDVEAALDRIIDYYDRHERSSPLPVILRRARRLVGADFLTVIRDIAPQGMDNVALVGGIADEED